MSWGERPEDFQGEPKNVFVNFLIWNLKNISTFLFYQRKFAYSIGPLMETISSLDGKSQKELEPEYNELLAATLGKKVLKEEDFYRIYRRVTAYLHETYLREVRLAIPKYPSSKIEAPKE